VSGTAHGLPRGVDALLAACALVVLTPLLLLIALLVRVTSPGPVLYRQCRVGRSGVSFTLLKFRSMRTAPGPVQALTVGMDARITRIGRWLRRHKLDELPQLVNVVRGDMALVGPRPEVREFLRLDLPEQHLVLRYRPGLTDPASLAFTEEASALAAAADAETAYREWVLPEKLRQSADYLERRSPASDVAVLARTVRCVLGLGASGAPAVPSRVAADHDEVRR
jgi:lipopolysaccharide/colanic/teichoic acid biosynthesis glycosyltransferase